MHIWGFLRNGEAQVIIRSSKLIIFDGEASPISGQTHIFQYSWLFEAKTGNAGDIRWHAHISSYFMGIQAPCRRWPKFRYRQSLQFPTSIFSVIFVLQSKSSGAIYLVSLLGVLYGEHGINRHVNETCRIWDNLDIFSGSLKWIYQMYPQVKPPLIKDGMEYDG